MRLLIATAVFVTSFAAAAADMNCSVKASKTASSAEMQGMAKVSADQAKKTALGAVKEKGTIGKGGLGVEDGCLVYSYNVEVAGKSGAEQVLVDAGNGKVLKTEHEGAVSNAMGKATDKMKK